MYISLSLFKNLKYIEKHLMAYKTFNFPAAFSLTAAEDASHVLLVKRGLHEVNKSELYIELHGALAEAYAMTYEDRLREAVTVAKEQGAFHSLQGRVTLIEVTNDGLLHAGTVEARSSNLDYTIFVKGMHMLRELAEESLVVTCGVATVLDKDVERHIAAICNITFGKKY